MEKISVTASPNLALAKYWGKATPSGNIPKTGSIGITLDIPCSETTVSFAPEGNGDSFWLDDIAYPPGSSAFDRYLFPILSSLRQRSVVKQRVSIVSRNRLPTGTGLASSSSGCAALALALSRLLGLELGREELSGIARLGSGSAARASLGGFVGWGVPGYAGEDGAHAVELFPASWWKELRVLICVTSHEPKAMSSREAMALSEHSSPFYQAWCAYQAEEIGIIERAIKERDFHLLATATRRNALRMHALTISSDPPLLFWNPASLNLIHLGNELMYSGFPITFTMDAGPQVKFLCLDSCAKELYQLLASQKGVKTVIETKPGEAPREISRHLEIPK